MIICVQYFNGAFYMDQNAKRIYLIRQLIEERPDKEEFSVPDSVEDQKRLLRGLFNVRLPDVTMNSIRLTKAKCYILS